MKKLLTLLLLLSFGQAAWCYNNTYAVIVGINDYRNDAVIKDLPYSLNNTRAIYNFLTSKEGGSVPAKNICYLTNAQATREGIISNAKAMFSKAKEGDRVIFYFAGHGGEGFFAPYDFDGFVESTVFYSDIKSIFRSAKCSTKLLFLDCCYAGSVKSRSNDSDRLRDRTSSDNLNIAVMSASKADEVSWQSSELGMGVFTYYLIRGLGGAANRDGNSYITIQELFYYVYKQVMAKTSGPGYASVQTPHLFGKFDLRLIVGEVNK